MDKEKTNYKFIEGKTCPYCQSKIKQGSDFTVCSVCGTPHHQECWSENLGCTTYGCKINPLTEKKLEVESSDIGGKTLNDIRQLIKPQESVNVIHCPNCNSDIEESSIYCKFCGFNLKENKFDDAKQEFEKEYKKRYRDKLSITRKRFLFTLGSVIFLVSALSFLFYLTVSRLNEYFSSDEYIIKSTVYNWKEAWEDENSDKFKSFLTKDYEYYGKDGKRINYDERLKRIEWTFKNYKDIKLTFSDFKIVTDSSTTSIDQKVRFYENYKSDKYRESGLKTLRLYKGEETNNEWKIYREFFD